MPPPPSPASTAERLCGILTVWQQIFSQLTVNLLSKRQHGSPSIGSPPQQPPDPDADKTIMAPLQGAFQTRLWAERGCLPNYSRTRLAENLHPVTRINDTWTLWSGNISADRSENRTGPSGAGGPPVRVHPLDSRSETCGHMQLFCPKLILFD